MQENKATTEARRVMEICNACRYCEGFCAVFPAMEERRTFASGDLNFLANLCHNCKGCYYACQYAPPHEFSVNIPQTFTEVRAESYEDYSWPKPLSRLLKRNGLAVSLIAAVVSTLVILLTIMLQDSSILFGTHSGPGAFYEVISYEVMVYGASAVFLFGIFALIKGFLAFWKDSGGESKDLLNPKLWAGALHDGLTLRFLSNSGDGCNYHSEHFTQTARSFHQLTMWGFLLCFAATSVATIYDHVFHWVAPYAYTSIPVILGTLGGIGLLIGPPGLLWLKLKADPEPISKRLWGMDIAFIVLLFLTSLTGLLLLAFRETSMMGILLAVHLGVVLSLFLTLPYGKMVHAVYRLGALLKHRKEQSS